VKRGGSEAGGLSWVVQRIDTAYCLCDPEGTIREGNEPLARLLGLAGDQGPEGLSLASRFPSGQEWRAFLDSLLATGEVHGRGGELCRSDGSRVQSVISAALVPPLRGRCSGFHILIREAGAREELASRLGDMEKMAALGQLAASIAHEINNPLNIILGYAQLLLREAEKGTTSLEHLKEIEECARMCRKVMGNLLAFTRKSEVSWRNIDVNEIIAEVMHLLANRFKTERIQVVQDLHSGLRLIPGDADRLKQVFFNILINAQHAVGTDGTITVRTCNNPETGQVVVSITDSGSGIPAEVRTRIFEPFYTTKEPGKGTGLGLTVSREIVAEHGGHIQVESTPGRGSTFKVLLPSYEP
jgi:signal transduction histidine kinase